VDSGGTVRYYWSDHLGTTRIVTDASGNVCYEADFYPYGGERAVTTTCSQSYKFTGKERDTETGNDNFGARYYPNNLGRFLTPDPLMASGRASNPQSWNRYAYTLNNPVRFIDPNGLQEQPCATTDQECAKRRQAANGKGKVTVTAGITILEPVTSDDRQAQKQNQPKLVIVVTSDTTQPARFNPGVTERDRNYTVETKEDDSFHADTSGKHFVTMDEKQTGGNDKPRLADPNEKGVPTLEDRIHVSAPGKSFTTTQTLHIDGSRANATIYERRSDGTVVSGTTVYVHAAAERVDVDIGP
jgi:RHS repeat-associated protein